MSKARQALLGIFDEREDVTRKLRAMWALHITGGMPAAQLTAALDDADEYIRSWAIQLPCEDQDPPPTALQRFAQLAVSDPSPVVRLYLAAALQRLAEVEIFVSSKEQPGKGLPCRLSIVRLVTKRAKIVEEPVEVKVEKSAKRAIRKGTVYTLSLIHI